jgi:outer membrane receptor protein involved in Fe transport
LNLAYRRESWRVSLAVRSLFDAEIYEPGGLNAIYPQAGRNAVASVGYTF